MNNELNDYKNMKYGIFLSAMIMVVSLLGTLFLTNRTLDLVGDYNYGLLSFVNSIVSWLTILSSALTASYLRFATIESKKVNNTSRINTLYFKMLSIIGLTILCLGFSVLLILYFCHVNIGDYSWEDSKIMYILFGLSVFNVSLSIPFTIFTLYINYKKKFVFSRIITILITILNYVGQFTIAYFFKNIIMIGAYSIVLTFLTFILNFLFCYKKLDIKFSKEKLLANRAILFPIISFSLILLFNSIVDQVNSNVDKTLLGIYSSPFDVTLYQMGQQFNVYLVSLSVAISSVFLPSIHEKVSNNDFENVNLIFLKVSKIQTFIICMVAFGFCACGRDFITWWIGDSRIKSYYIGAVLMLIDLCPLSLNLSIEIQRAESKHLFRAFVYFLVAIVNVVLSIIFLHIFSLENAIYACLLGSVISRLLSHWIAMNLYNKFQINLPVGQYLMILFKYILIGGFAFLFVYIVEKYILYNNIDWIILRLFIEGVIFVIIYLLLVFIFDKKFFINTIVKKIFH